MKLAPPEAPAGKDEVAKGTPGSAGDKGQRAGQGTGGRAYWKVRTGCSRIMPSLSCGCSCFEYLDCQTSMQGATSLCGCDIVFFTGSAEG